MSYQNEQKVALLKSLLELHERFIVQSPRKVDAEIGFALREAVCRVAEKVEPAAKATGQAEQAWLDKVRGKK